MKLLRNFYPCRQNRSPNATYAKAVKKLVKEEGFDLIESLAEAIANKILEFERVQQVRVRLTKEAAPIPDFDGSITIDITRYNPVV